MLPIKAEGKLGNY